MPSKAKNDRVQVILDAIESLTPKQLDKLSQQLRDALTRWECDLRKSDQRLPMTNHAKLAHEIGHSHFMAKYATPMDQAVNNWQELRRRLKERRTNDDEVTEQLQKVAALESQGFTESEACQQLGYDYKQHRNRKSYRNKKNRPRGSTPQQILAWAKNWNALHNSPGVRRARN